MIIDLIWIWCICTMMFTYRTIILNWFNNSYINQKVWVIHKDNSNFTYIHLRNPF